MASFCLCPSPCIKAALVVVSTVLFLLAGSSFFVAGFSFDSEVLQAFDVEVKSTVFATFLVIGTVLLVASVAGIYTSFRYRPSCCLILGVFSLAATAGFIAWFAVSVVAYKELMNAVQDEDCPSTNPVLTRMQEAIIAMDLVLCSKWCPCDQAYKDNF